MRRAEGKSFFFCSREFEVEVEVEEKRKKTHQNKRRKKLKNRRLVDEYRRSGPGQPYELVLEGVEFSKYMREHRGFHIIPISGDVSLLSF